VNERAMGKEQFSYWITKNGKVFVYWRGNHGNRGIVLKGTRAERPIRDLPGMNPDQQQLALARATGNFKRGNEPGSSPPT
jgi:hypothetical protein